MSCRCQPDARLQGPLRDRSAFAAYLAMRKMPRTLSWSRGVGLNVAHSRSASEQVSVIWAGRLVMDHRAVSSM